MSLEEAVSNFVSPGLTVHAGCSFAFPHAAWYEIARQFRGTQPEFTAVMAAGVCTNLAVWAQAELCSRAITSIAGDAYPFPGPNRILQNAVADGRLQIEHWTMLTLVQRLMAGAMGLPFMPTRSIAGSDIEPGAGDNFQRASETSGSTQESTVGLVSALRPDISLAHAVAADRAGNTLVTAPLAGNVYGALAAKSGVIVTVERVVDTEDLQTFSSLVRIPASVVLAVCETPWGAHPSGQAAEEVPWFDGYSEDPQFITEARRACRNRDAFQQWVQEWVMEPRSHSDYIEKLGNDRFEKLKRRLSPDSWQQELARAIPRLRRDAATDSERMIVLAARTLAQRIRDKGHQTLLAGLGASNLAAWLCADRLAEDGTSVSLMAELGFYGYSPRPADSYLFNLRNLPTCSQTTDILTVMGVYAGGSSARCIGSLGAGQVDRLGNLNSTVGAKGELLIGSGGANDVASTAAETVVCAEQNSARFVEQVDYVTAPGSRITAVATQHGLLEKPVGKDELVLTGFFATDSDHETSAVKIAVENCGWRLRVASELVRLAHPSEDELAVLRAFDPERYFLGK